MFAPLVFRGGAVGLFAVAAVFVSAFAAAGGGDLRLAATTSADNSGLLAHILPEFEKECGCRVRVVVGGSGKALKLGESGDVDLLFVHAPEEEKKFVREGYGVGRKPVMHNAFVLVGPPEDPAAAAQAESVAGAMLRVKESGAVFVSRGDDSGTHKKEAELWQSAGENAGEFSGEWYVSAGAGMARALLMADQLRGYALADDSTFAVMRDKTALRVLAKNSPPLKNQYSIILINPARHPQTRAELARRFARWILSPPAQELIGGYRFSGARLFAPSAAR